MSTKTIQLFPDTNLFVQCRPLDQLNWSLVGEFDEIDLIVSRPIQSEIDNQKNKGRDRLGDRARATSSLFREMIISGHGKKIIKEQNPIVRLSIRQELRPIASLADRLNYDERDDQLVGIAYGFRQDTAGADVRVLTHDIGPMASAQMVGLPFIPIPDDWLLAPETTEAEKKVTALKKEIARLKDNEPNFSISFLNHLDTPAEILEVDVVEYQPVRDSEVGELMSRIKSKFALESDFGPRDSSHRTGRRFGFSLPETFVPATENEIASYRARYPKWLVECEEKLRSFHDILQRQEGFPHFTFVAVNDGTRPGKDVLVSVKARGNFAIVPPPSQSDSNEEETESIALPTPPPVPRGTWKTSGFLGEYQDVMGRLGNFWGPTIGHIVPERVRLGPFDVPKHDPNAFYYKPKRPSTPSSEFELDCEQWRHGIDAEKFRGEIHVEEQGKDISGALEFWIHAENLTDPIMKRVPVRISIRQESAYYAAKNRVEYLLAGIRL
jgi:PIN domain-containing protein